MYNKNINLVNNHNKKGEKMNKKTNSSNKEGKSFSKDKIGFIQNEDNTILFGVLDEEKEQMQFASRASIYKFKKQGSSYILTSGYGLSEITKGVPIVELETLCNGVNLDNETKEKYTNLKAMLSRPAYSKKGLSSLEGMYNNVAHAIKHCANKEKKQKIEEEPQM